MLRKKRDKKSTYSKEKIVQSKIFLTPQFRLGVIWFLKWWEIKVENWDKKKKVRKGWRYEKERNQINNNKK